MVHGQILAFIIYRTCDSWYIAQITTLDSLDENKERYAGYPVGSAILQDLLFN